MSNGMVDMEVQGPENKIEKLISIINQGNYFIKVTSTSNKKIDVISTENKFIIK